MSTYPPDKPHVHSFGVGEWPPTTVNDSIAKARRDQIAAAVITGYLASFANPSVKLAETGLPSPERMATVVAAYTNAILKELDA